MNLSEIFNPWGNLRAAKAMIKRLADDKAAAREQQRRDLAKIEYVRSLLPQINFRCPDTGKLLPKGEIPTAIRAKLRSHGIVH